MECSKFEGQFAKGLSTNGLLVITTSAYVLNCDYGKERPNTDSAVRVLELRLLNNHASTFELSWSWGRRRRACPTRLRGNSSNGERVAIRYDGWAVP